MKPLTICISVLTSILFSACSHSVDSGVPVDKAEFDVSTTLEHDPKVVEWWDNSISNISLNIKGEDIQFPDSFIQDIKGIHHDNYTLTEYEDHYTLSFAGGDGGETFGVHYTIRGGIVESGYKGWSVPTWTPGKNMPTYEHKSEKLPLQNKTLHPTADRG
ncbi:hypothetical protein ACFSW8_09840 [Rubritalea tangerina]|uniref:Uncharacterized protein n=1 Tax=Rubritalea tangerina TaxID=430798 RepID=A0ABW4ZB65_9BACT